MTRVCRYAQVLNLVIKQTADGKFEGADSLEGVIRSYKKKALQKKGGGSVKQVAL